MRLTHLFGLLLWRGGLLLAGAAACFEVARRIVRFVDVPVPVEIGIGLVLGGAMMVLLSLVWERIQDLREEDISE